MNTTSIKLPKQMVDYLISLPENGMGFQLVKVFLKDGKVLRKHKVINASVLLTNTTEYINPSQILKLELEQ